MKQSLKQICQIRIQRRTFWRARESVELKKILLLPVTLAALVNTCKPCSTNTVFKYYALTALTKYFLKDKHGPGTSSFFSSEKDWFFKKWSLLSNKKCKPLNFRGVTYLVCLSNLLTYTRQKIEDFILACFLQYNIAKSFCSIEKSSHNAPIDIPSSIDRQWFALSGF